MGEAEDESVGIPGDGMALAARQSSAEVAGPVLDRNYLEEKQEGEACLQRHTAVLSSQEGLEAIPLEVREAEGVRGRNDPTSRAGLRADFTGCRGLVA